MDNVEQAQTSLTSLRGIANSFLALLPQIIIGIVVFILFYLAALAVRSAILRSTRGSGMGKALSRLARLGVILAGFLIATVIVFPSVTPASALGALGFGSVAIGFAFRDILQNYFAGILLLWREPFRVGDQIETTNGFVGTVEAVETRATMIRTYDGRRVVIPNTNLFTDSVMVNTAYKVRRSEYDVGIGYGDAIERARRVMMETLRETEGVLQDPAPDVLVVDLAGSSVNLRARWWTSSARADVLNVQDKVLTALKNALTKEGIDLPFPTQQILFHDQTEASDGDRTKQREGWPAGKNPPERDNLPHAVGQLRMQDRVKDGAQAVSQDSAQDSVQDSAQHLVQNPTQKRAGA